MSRELEKWRERHSQMIKETYSYLDKVKSGEVSVEDYYKICDQKYNEFRQKNSK